MSVRVRYAPSPTGSPHVGNLRTAIFDWLLARKTGGAFIARLEDTDRDPTRYKPEHITEIENSLRFLGTVPDEWWVTGGPAGPYVQSERVHRYQEVAEELIRRGRAYRCYCTREELKEMRERQQARGLPTGYDRRHRNLTAEQRAKFEAEGRPSVVRLAIPTEGRTTYHDLVYGDITVDNRVIEDVVLLKSNGWPTYHLAAMVDDHDMGITHVIRGEDWMPSTPQHVQIYRAMDWEEPIWVHVPLILGTDRKKLSKRHGSTQFMDFVREGYLPDALLNFLVLLGWSAGDENREIFTREELIERFSLEAISRNPAVFDYSKLRWMNGEYIRALVPDRLLEYCTPYLVEAGLLSDPPDADQMAYAARILPLVSDRMKLLSEAPELMGFFFHAPETPEEKGRRKWLAAATADPILSEAIARIEALPGELTVESAEQITDAIAEKLGLARGPVIHTLRVSATGRTVGPGLFETLNVLGGSRVLPRLQLARQWAEDARSAAGTGKPGTATAQ